MKNIFINKIPVDGKENSESTDFFHIYVHPYFIKNIPHIIYPRGLAERVKQTRLNSPLADSLFHILFSRYQEQKNDPGYIVDDLKKMANYYSEFPEVIALLESLKEKAGHSRLMQTTG